MDSQRRLNLTLLMQNEWKKSNFGYQLKGNTSSGTPVTKDPVVTMFTNFLLRLKKHHFKLENLVNNMKAR